MLDTLSIIVNTTVSVISAIIDFAAVPLSAASVFILVVDRHEKKESEKMKLIVTPKRKSVCFTFTSVFPTNHHFLYLYWI